MNGMCDFFLVNCVAVVFSMSTDQPLNTTTPTPNIGARMPSADSRDDGWSSWENGLPARQDAIHTGREMVPQDPTRGPLGSEAAGSGPCGSPNLSLGFGGSGAFWSGFPGSAGEKWASQDQQAKSGPPRIGHALGVAIVRNRGTRRITHRFTQHGSSE